MAALPFDPVWLSRLCPRGQRASHRPRQFNWNGIGQLSLQAVALKDVPALVVCGVVLVSVFAILSAVADLSRPRALYRPA